MSEPLLALTPRQVAKARAQRLRLVRAKAQRQAAILASAKAQAPRMVACWLTVALMGLSRARAAKALGLSASALQRDLSGCTAGEKLQARMLLSRLEQEHPLPPWWQT